LNTENLIPYEKIKKEIWETGAEIFIPAASSRLIHQEHIERLLHNGLELIACGANVPFADNEIFFGPVAEYADNHASVIPDFVSNCGMARVFAFLMSDEAKISDKAIFADVSNCISDAMEEIFRKHAGPKRISQTALEIALEKLL